jgi:hypothetical protein
MDSVIVLLLHFRNVDTSISVRFEKYCLANDVLLAGHKFGCSPESYARPTPTFQSAQVQFPDECKSICDRLRGACSCILMIPGRHSKRSHITTDWVSEGANEHHQILKIDTVCSWNICRTTSMYALAVRIVAPSC